MLTSYSRVLGRPGALRFSLTGMFARLPISMVGLGIVLLVQSSTGSYGLAGAVSAAYMLANALLAIAQGRLVDRLGQGPVLSTVSVVFGVALVLLIWSVRADWPVAATYAAAALAGASLPQIGSCVRARWSHVLEAPAEVQTAYALEAVVDEVCFILGPILVTVLATSVHPVAGLGSALVFGVVGGLAFAAQRGTEPPPQRHDRATGRRPGLPWRTVVPLVAVSFLLGVLFGAAEVTTIAFADERGNRAWAGALLALWALGSLVSGVITGAVIWRAGPATRLKWGALAMAAAMAPLPFIGSLPLMGVVLLIGGAAIAPTMVATMSLTEATVPRSRLTEGMSVMQTGLIAGVAPGATLSGIVVDASGASAAYLVSAAAGLLAVLAAQTLPRRLPVPADPVTSGAGPAAP
ncbi:Major Facilitator Superfamily protein [Nocardioides dokdonensis FR1436]|uniref:Major Facilitator Superfamily protein n=1 Tax=Nocardioides dokdonensis FR1436 TaxID=1300347 RepID=A0A1A9GR98_9ACTN|nr:MFS transporter [Nocardioides dokdonensis]ANH40001.1 Major Facilitator Superfamily protein [Nocardioides dokdonensis FR1436]